MDTLINSILLILFTFIFLQFLHSFLLKHKPPLPPGPRGLPLIGNLHQLGQKPHQTLAKLSKIHGPIISLKLGQITTIVMSSVETAKSVLQINDQSLCNRTIPDAMKGANHHHYSLPFIPLSQRWKDLRKICNNLLFSSKNLDMNHTLRHKKILELLNDINNSTVKFEAVNIGRLAFKTTINMLSNTVYSVDLVRSSDIAGEFKELVTNIMKEVGRANIADCFPVLKVVDPIGIRRRTGEYFGKLLGIFQGLVDQRLKMRELKGYCGKSDMLDAMLDDENNVGDMYKDKIERLSVDLFVAGTDTVTSTVEWAMAELLHNPNIMTKAKSELNQIIGKGNIVEESDIGKLPYLQAIIKETFRLHPAVPLLLPRKAEIDLEINGYKVPKGAQVLINVWAIGRDSNLWENPNEFLPERFLGSDIDFKGRNFELTPFGGGRRIPPLQFELTRRQNEESAEAFDSLKRLIETLENENTTLKMEKSEIEAALEKSRKSFTEKMLSDALHIQKKDLSSINDMPDHSDNFPGKEEMERSLQKLSNDLKETRLDRDKALQELSRLKQHLLEKASEEAEKMDEDSVIIEELRDSNNYLRAQISHLERTLKQAIASQEELKMANNIETLKSREIIDDLNKKLTNCLSAIDSKNIELSNLQTALGQYYAEIEAKEHLEEELAWARKETTKLSQLLKDADQRADVSKAENDETLAKLSQSEKAQSEWKARVSKLEEDNARLRRAVEQSMTRLNRMSVDSDYLVDRRIVIKLLVTYFQRNHSREVLDLMVRMLGFSDEDKQRIGIAQQGASNGVIRGVFRLPGRLVGGILGGSSTEAAANAGSDNQSFADLWVDFLLKETEERERRELSGNTGTSTETSHDKSPNTISTTPSLPNQRFGSVPLPPLPNQRSASAFPINSTNQNLSLLPPSYLQRPENFGSDFSTVPLTPSDAKTSGSNQIPRY